LLGIIEDGVEGSADHATGDECGDLRAVAIERIVSRDVHDRDATANVRQIG